MEYISKLKISVLVTCHNRKQKTLTFLESLIGQDYFRKLNIDIFLLDDASTDNTSAAVKKKYPFVNIVEGTGSLFWAGGMRVIWEYAIAKNDYDLYLLFNDDVVLFKDALAKLITNYIKVQERGTILIGSCLSPETNKITYGGISLRDLKHCIYYRTLPDEEKPVPCQLGNANILLVDKATVKKIGIFSSTYIHSLADFDYTLTAYKSGINLLIAPGYYGYCEDDHGVNWLSGNSSLKKRIAYLYSPKGLTYREYMRYIKKHFPADYFSSIIKLWLKTLFPIIWEKFKVGGSIR
ncbi:MAG: glycosyltransferase family 2 protein [Mucilaginibacter sp.]